MGGPQNRNYLHIFLRRRRRTFDTITVNEALEKEILGLVEGDLRKAYAIAIKQERYAAVGAVKERLLAHFDRARVPVAAVVPIDEVADDPQLAWRLARTGAPVGAPVPLVMTSPGPAPRLGEHTAAILGR